MIISIDTCVFRDARFDILADLVGKDKPFIIGTMIFLSRAVGNLHKNSIEKNTIDSFCKIENFSDALIEAGLAVEKKQRYLFNRDQRFI